MLLIGRPRPVIVYPFDGTYNNRELLDRNPPAYISLVRPADGPDRRPLGSYELVGRPDSYIKITNLGRLDIVKSITISMWIYPKAPGPIIHYDPNGDGLKIWLVSSNILMVRYVTRSPRRKLPYLAGRVKLWRWNYISTTYNKKTGEAALYVNRKLVSKRRIGRVDLATNYPVIIGAKPGNSNRYRGRISCLQLFNYALTHRQVYEARKKCFGSSKYLIGQLIDNVY